MSDSKLSPSETTTLPVMENLAALASDLGKMAIHKKGCPNFHELSIADPYMILYEISDPANDRIAVMQFASGVYKHQEYTGQDRARLLTRPQHGHSFIEIMFVLSGTLTNEVGEQVYTYKKNDCCIMNRNMNHSERFDTDHQVLFLMVSDELLAELLRTAELEQSPQGRRLAASLIGQIAGTTGSEEVMDKVYLDCFPVLPEAQIDAVTVPLFNDLLIKLIEQPVGYTYQVKGNLLALLNLLLDPALYSVEKISASYRPQEFIYTKIDHLMKASRGRYTRDQLSEQLHYTGEYINRIVKRYTGQSITDYGRSIMLEESCRLLRDTDASVSEIITNLGFSNRSHFYRLFTEQDHITPKEYRQINRD